MMNDEKKYYSLFFPGRRVRAHLQNPVCNITVFCTVNQVQAAIFVSSCLSFPFMFCIYFVLCPFIY
jgi:hypothetical protein